MDSINSTRSKKQVCGQGCPKGRTDGSGRVGPTEKDPIRTDPLKMDPTRPNLILFVLFPPRPDPKKVQLCPDPILFQKKMDPIRSDPFSKIKDPTRSDPFLRIKDPIRSDPLKGSGWSGPNSGRVGSDHRFWKPLVPYSLKMSIKHKFPKYSVLRENMQENKLNLRCNFKTNFYFLNVYNKVHLFGLEELW